MITIKLEDIKKSLKIIESLVKKSYPQDKVGLNYNNRVLILFSVCQTTQSCFYYTIESTGISENFSIDLDTKMLSFLKDNEGDLSIATDAGKQKVTLAVNESKLTIDLTTFTMPYIASIDKNDDNNKIYLHANELLAETKIGVNNIREHIDEKRNGMYIYGVKDSPFLGFITNNGFRIYNRTKYIIGTLINHENEPTGIYLREKYMKALNIVLKEVDFIFIQFDDSGKGILTSECGKVKIKINNEFIFPKFTYDHASMVGFTIETKVIKEVLESLIKKYSKKKYLPLTIVQKEDKLVITDHTKDDKNPTTESNFQEIAIGSGYKGNQDIAIFTNMELLLDIVKLVKSKYLQLYTSSEVPFIKIIPNIKENDPQPVDIYICGFVNKYAFDFDRSK